MYTFSELQDIAIASQAVISEVSELYSTHGKLHALKSKHARKCIKRASDATKWLEQSVIVGNSCNEYFILADAVISWRIVRALDINEISRTLDTLEDCRGYYFV